MCAHEVNQQWNDDPPAKR
jgi:hypothetical protein